MSTLIVGGWKLYAHPLLQDQLAKLTDAVVTARKREPKTWQTTANAKLLAALRRLMFESVPDDPSRAEYRQGATLGEGHKHWFRAKFGNGRFRLFFRYSSTQRAIIYAWVNDSESLRAYGSRTDAYAVFQKMLNRGNPPDNWEALLAETDQSKGLLERLAATSEPE